MIQIEDKLRTLNLNHMAIYLMLTADEMAQYGAKLQDLNNDKNLTRGIFHFEVVEKGDTPYERLPQDLTRCVASCNNVLFRPVDTIHRIFCYCLDYVDLTQDEDQIRKALNIIVNNVCDKNRFQLDILRNRNTGTAQIAVEIYHMCNIVEDVFNRARNGEIIPEEDCPTMILESSMHTPSLMDSDDLVREAFTNSQSDKLEMERYEREIYNRRANISITLKNVPSSKIENGEIIPLYNKEGMRPKKSFGIELRIDDEVINIPLKSSEQQVLYASIALAHTRRRILRRRDFTDNANPRAVQLIHEVFTSFAMETSFDDWMANVNRYGPAARINDAKSKINKLLWKYIPPKYKYVYSHVCIINEKTGPRDSRYLIRIKRENIHIQLFGLEDSHELQE